MVEREIEMVYGCSVDMRAMAMRGEGKVEEGEIGHGFCRFDGVRE